MTNARLSRLSPGLCTFIDAVSAMWSAVLLSLQATAARFAPPRPQPPDDVAQQLLDAWAELCRFDAKLSHIGVPFPPIVSCWLLFGGFFGISE